MFLRSRYPLAILAGLLLAFSFPKFGIAGFAWIAPGFILGTALGKRGGESFRIGYVAGLAHYLTSLSWLLNIPVRGYPILGWIALSAFLALLPATWVWLSLKVSGFEFLVSSFETAHPAQLKTQNSKLKTHLPQSLSQRIIWSFVCAAIWVALEMFVARIFGGFPWNLLGDSQFQIIPLIQIASFTGVYGVSFLVAWTSVSLLCAVAAILAKPTLRSAWIAEIIFPFGAIALAFAFGLHALSETPAPSRELNVALIQPSIPQTMIWNPENDFARFENLIQLSNRALTNHVDLVIWPEAAVPGFARWDENVHSAIVRFVREHHIWLILGSDDLGPLPHPTAKEKYEYYNASFLVSPEGEFVSRYRKRSLVMFGEYIPFEHALPFIKWFTPVTGSYTPGDRAVPFEMNFPESFGRVVTSTLICFEDNFPQLVREYVHDDTDFLVNLTNNGWFGEGAAQWQHGANAIFRAVENGVPLVRCTNNGLTCWADRHGRLREIFRDENKSIYGAGFMIVKIPLLNPGEKRALTFYNQHGDWLGWSCVALSGLALIFSWRNGKRRNRRA
ncbi:MAG TPA: apolipoprotein N-acyltransferase [Verrucomicrobiae bacterium]|nr:apolipoprotein N-acyltransferase [Verrucomicrobiae bacterium]